MPLSGALSPIHLTPVPVKTKVTEEPAMLEKCTSSACPQVPSYLILLLELSTLSQPGGDRIFPCHQYHIQLQILCDLFSFFNVIESSTPAIV